MTRTQDFLFTTEYIENVLYFGVVRQGKVLQNTKFTTYFSIDEELVYDNFLSDFGPLNLGCVYKYCRMLNDKIKHCIHFTQKLVHYTSSEPKKKANAAFLIACFGVLYLSRSPRDALKPLIARNQFYKPFQDATPNESPYTITILDCLEALKKAKEFSFINFHDFDLEEYEKYNRIEGDLNWIIPGKFLAFIGPVDSNLSLYHPPEMFLEYFLQNNVKIVIRLNKRLYDANVFLNSGIMHYDLFFPDGTCPPRHILMKFFHISEDANCALGVHCKAGLGRTGSLIGCYLIKHYGMTAHEAIGWMRICRPGSVIGQQQGWLEKMENWLLKQGDIYRKRNYQDAARFPYHKYGIYSVAEKSARRRRFVKSRSPTPPCYVTRVVSSGASPKSTSPTRNRPIPSKIKDFATAIGSKPVPRDPSDWRTIITSKSPNSCPISEVKMMSRGTKYISGAGEPKTSYSGSKHGTNATRRNYMHKSNDSNNARTWNDCHLATFRASQVPLIKTVNDAKQFLMNSYNYVRRAKERESIHSPTNTLVINKSSEISSSKNIQHKRRLGRSPSPPGRNAFERSRAKYTQPNNDKTLMDSTTCLRDALSRLKLTPQRDGSTGAASLGARREAPPGRPSPSVRSDERPTATQGDILNSIKLQRKLRNTLLIDRCETKRTVEKSNSGNSKMENLENNNRMYYRGRPTTSKPRRTSNDFSK